MHLTVTDNEDTENKYAHILRLLNFLYMWISLAIIKNEKLSF